jgi:ABC-type oligopeptide transport system ATPase subunit
VSALLEQAPILENQDTEIDLTTVKAVLDWLNSLEKNNSPEMLNVVQDTAFPAFFELTVSEIELELFLRTCCDLTDATNKAMRQTWDNFLKAQGDKPSDTDKPKESDRLVSLAQENGTSFFVGHDGAVYADVIVNDHRETFAVKKSSFSEWLEAKAYRKWKRSVSNQAMTDARSTLSAFAKHDENRKDYRVSCRLAEHDGRVYLDLGNVAWDAVEVDSSGWRMVKMPPVRFVRNGNMQPLPEPQHGGNINELFDLLNIESIDRSLLAAWLVQCLNPKEPYPLLALHGEQGSSKSTTAKLLKRLIDPGAGELLSEPKDLESFMTTVKNRHIVAFDNLSSIPTWLSDGLCRTSTGGGISKRALYSNDEEIIIEAVRPIILTGITQLSTRPDLLERTIMLELPEIPPKKRQELSHIHEQFEAIRPRILGALLDGVSSALKHQKEVSAALTERPRMADFAVWAIAAETAFGFEKGSFLEAFTGNQRESQNLIVQNDPVLRQIIEFVKRVTRWQGTSSDLLERLEAEVSEEIKRNRAWVKSPKLLSEKLTRNASVLRNHGIAVDKHRTKSSRELVLELCPLSASPSSPASLVRTGRLLEGDVESDDLSPNVPTASPQPAKGDAQTGVRHPASPLRHPLNSVHNDVNQNGDADDAQSGVLSKIENQRNPATEKQPSSVIPPQTPKLYADPAAGSRGSTANSPESFRR